MSKNLQNFVDEEELPVLREFLFSLPDNLPGPIILRNDIMHAFKLYLQGLEQDGDMPGAWLFLGRIQELMRMDDRLVFIFRRQRARSRIYEIQRRDNKLKQLTVKDFLTIKEKLLYPDLPVNERTSLEVNLAPFYDYGPHLKDPDSIGQGIKHLNRYMSTNLVHEPDKMNSALYEFLKLHHLHGRQLLLDGSLVRNSRELETVLEDAVDIIERRRENEGPGFLRHKLAALGLLDGWGNSAVRILETINLLRDVLQQPDENNLEEFLARVPMVSKVALISPHGWFGQKNVLGRPDTGGQVVYVLDQACAMEQYMRKDLRLSGLEIKPRIVIVTRLIPENDGTTSDQCLEKVDGTDNVWILRVPFRDHNGEIVPYWMSRFKVWPYLERFSREAEQEIMLELGGRPDLIVGNYSDGNLVATKLSKRLGVIQCNIAHALEKSKYLFSDLYWHDFEEQYNFSIQFMADLIAMNLTNFIITSTSQEISGTESSIGQYESYQFFIMPGLMKVVSGIQLFHPRFNVIPPGVNNRVFYPYTLKKRKAEVMEEMNRILFEAQDESCLGYLERPELPPIFSIARLDRIKNLTGLVEAYGRNPELMATANMVIIASVINPDNSNDQEEKSEINRMHELINELGLAGHIRWIGRRLSKEQTGEAYRVVADRKGIFVQPALFEAFGLTILEAMHSGLPVFATKFGGPLEIIKDGISGFLINPTEYEQMSNRLLNFFKDAGNRRGYWQKISKAGLQRASSRFTWERHCQMLTRLTKVYGFWRYSISNQAKSRLSEYCHLLYELYFKERAGRLVEPRGE